MFGAIYFGQMYLAGVFSTTTPIADYITAIEVRTTRVDPVASTGASGIPPRTAGKGAIET